MSLNDIITCSPAISACENDFSLPIGWPRCELYHLQSCLQWTACGLKMDLPAHPLKTGLACENVSFSCPSISQCGNTITYSPAISKCENGPIHRPSVGQCGNTITYSPAITACENGLLITHRSGIGCAYGGASVQGSFLAWKSTLPKT